MALNLICFVTIAYLLITLMKPNEGSEHFLGIDSSKATESDTTKNSVTSGNFDSSVGHLTDLRINEIHYVLRFLHNVCTHLDLIDSDHINMTANFVYSVELYIPQKSDILNYLDNNATSPPRRAKVIIFNGPHRQVDEYIVGPISNNIYSMSLNLSGTIPFKFRPITFSEVFGVFTTLMNYRDLHTILLESYGATLFDCIDKQGNQRCLAPLDSYRPVTELDGRTLWIMLYYDVKYFTLYPIDMQIMIDVNSADPVGWKIIKVWYANRLHESFNAFRNGYMNNSIPKIKRSFPTDIERGSLDIRFDVDDSDEKIEIPVPIVSTNSNIKLQDQTVLYKKWQFSWINTLTKGASLFNIKFGGERIAYEISLQEIAVLYTGSSPAMKNRSVFDSFSGLGAKSVGLVPGVDCPHRAEFVNVTVTTGDFHIGGILPNAFCIFEHNTELPLRRHYSTNEALGGLFYGGMQSTVLIFRSIYTINNYDYVMDYTFHENGVIKLNMYPTGYVQAYHSWPGSKQYGYNLSGNITAPVHHHLFHFKVDFDILGAENRYSTTTVVRDTATDENVHFKLHHSIKRSEKEATVETDTASTHHIFYNNNKFNQNQEKRGYRLEASGLATSQLQGDEGIERSMTWARYQIAVTKHKQTELSSSSTSATLDISDPVVDFKSFVDDDESIIDQVRCFEYF